MGKKISGRDFIKGSVIDDRALLIPTKVFSLGSGSIK